VRDLHHAYGSFVALDGIDLEVATGEIFALLGPNGAGKTTTVDILEGYRHRTAGHVAVLGHDPGHPRPGLALADRARARAPGLAGHARR
jgi:ABC-2 type transport system ATP-binding protein